MIVVALYLKILDFQEDVAPCISYGKTSLFLGTEINFSRMRRHEDFTESENCACMVQINRTKKRGGEVFFYF